jgi:hypothetical protein
VAVAGGPAFAGALDVLDGIRSDTAARTSQEDLIAYLIDPDKADSVGQKDSLSHLLSTAHDALQLFSDDSTMVPVYHAFAAALAAPASHPNGYNVVDSSTALLSRIAGQAMDTSGKEVCSKEIDPNGVVDIALAHLVTPMPSGSGSPGETPLEVIVEAIADVNRQTPSDTTNPLAAGDYHNITQELTSFLVAEDRGLEQLYAIVRTATEPQ